MKKVKTKVKDLALEISVEIKDILSKCKELSIIARSSSSNISDEDAEKIKKEEQKEAFERLYPEKFNINIWTLLKW